MARSVNVYIKKKLRLELLTVPQQEMYALGNIGLSSIIGRVSKARDANDAPAPPLKSESWKRIKKAKGLRPIRDLRGTGMMWPAKGGKRKPVLKQVGHLLDQIKVRRVADNMAMIQEPSTRAGRIKARAAANRAMLMWSPNDRAVVVRAANRLLNSLMNKMVKVTSR